MVVMNMIVNTSDLVGFEAETQKRNKAAAKAALSKLIASWESKQANKAKKLGGFGLLAVSLAACNSSNDLTDSSGVEHASVDAAITSNDAAIATAATTAATTAALTDSGGTVHASVNAAITSNDAAITTAALTDSSGTVHTSVNAAITSNDSAVTDAAVAAATSFTKSY